jgi:hypothetical protein
MAKSQNVSKSGGSVVNDLQHLAVPFGLLLAKRGLDSVLKKKGSKKGSKSASPGRRSAVGGVGPSVKAPEVAGIPKISLGGADRTWRAKGGYVDNQPNASTPPVSVTGGAGLASNIPKVAAAPSAKGGEGLTAPLAPPTTKPTATKGGKSSLPWFRSKGGAGTSSVTLPTKPTMPLVTKGGNTQVKPVAVAPKVGNTVAKPTATKGGNTKLTVPKVGNTVAKPTATKGGNTKLTLPKVGNTVAKPAVATKGGNTKLTLPKVGTKGGANSGNVSLKKEFADLSNEIMKYLNNK